MAQAKGDILRKVLTPSLYKENMTKEEKKEEAEINQRSKIMIYKMTGTMAILLIAVLAIKFTGNNKEIILNSETNKLLNEYKTLQRLEREFCEGGTPQVKNDKKTPYSVNTVNFKLVERSIRSEDKNPYRNIISNIKSKPEVNGINKVNSTQSYFRAIGDEVDSIGEKIENLSGGEIKTVSLNEGIKDDLCVADKKGGRTLITKTEMINTKTGEYI